MLIIGYEFKILKFIIILNLIKSNNNNPFTNCNCSNFVIKLNFNKINSTNTGPVQALGLTSSGKGRDRFNPLFIFIFLFLSVLFLNLLRAERRLQPCRRE